MTEDIKNKINAEAEKYANKDFFNKSSWEYNNQYNSFKDGYSLASAEIEELKKEVQQLRQWKAEAISVTPDMQAIGKALNIQLGASVYDKILPEILRLKTLLQVQVTGNCSCENCADIWNKYKIEHNV